jgi:hypothetical protein
MPVVFLIASDWTLRAALGAELRERGVEALGMEASDEVGRALASGEMPSAVVLDATASVAADPTIRKLVETVPTVVVASRTETIQLPPVAAVLYRPVRIADIVEKIRRLLEQVRPA